MAIKKKEQSVQTEMIEKVKSYLMEKQLAMKQKTLFAIVIVMLFIFYFYTNLDKRKKYIVIHYIHPECTDAFTHIHRSKIENTYKKDTIIFHYNKYGCSTEYDVNFPKDTELLFENYFYYYDFENKKVLNEVKGDFKKHYLTGNCNGIPFEIYILNKSKLTDDYADYLKNFRYEEKPCYCIDSLKKKNGWH